MEMKSRGPLGMPEEAVVEETGRASEDWYVLLDAWGAPEKGHVAIVQHLQEVFGLSDRWANTIAIRYEAARDLQEESSVPADLISAMILKPAARVAFESLPSSAQRNLVDYIENGDEPADRRDRISDVVIQLAAG